MADTKRTLSALQALLADNILKSITAQKVRDMLVSVAGSRRFDSYSINTTLSTDNDIVLVDASGAAVVITLPTAVGNSHKTFLIKKYDTSANYVKVAAAGGEFVDGHAQEFLIAPYSTLEVVSDGVGWAVIGPALTVQRQLFTPTADLTIASSITETSIVGTGRGSMTLPALWSRVARQLELDWSGFLSNTGAPTARLKFKLGSVTLLDSGAVATPSGVTNVPIRVHVTATNRLTGASGQWSAQGYCDIGIAGLRLPLVNTAVDVIDTTISNLADLTFTWGTNSASNTVTWTDGSLKAIN